MRSSRRHFRRLGWCGLAVSALLLALQVATYFWTLRWATAGGRDTCAISRGALTAQWGPLTPNDTIKVAPGLTLSHRQWPMLWKPLMRSIPGGPRTSVVVPFWLLLCGLAPLAGALLWLGKPVPPGLCGVCRYDLRGLAPGTRRCPECGATM